MKSPEYIREAREGQTKFLILCRHTRRRDQTSTSWCYRLPVSIFDAFFRLRRVWLSLFSLVFPLLLFCFVDSHDARFRCLYVVCVMISSWLTAANDPVLVAIYPIILCPLLGIAGVKSLAESYFRPVSFLMMGTSLVAAAFSRTGLDATISAFILKKFNSNPPLLCLGLMLCSATLSMWINNASTAVILSPIAIHVLAGWAKRLKEDSDLQQVLLSVSKKNGAAESSHKIPLAPPTRYDSLAGLKSLASTSAEAVSSVVPSKEAILAYVEKDHGKAYTDCFPRTEAPLHSTREQERNGDYRAGTALGVTADEVKTTAPLPPAAASARKSLIGGGGQESSNSGARIVSDTGTVLDHSTSKYCDTTSSTSLTFIEEDKDAHLLRRLKNMILLGIAYSATLGGMSTLNGSFVNPTLVHVLESSYDFDSAAQENPINFTSWMAFACPLALFCVFLAWLALSSVWLGVFTTAHAVLWLVIHPFTVVVAAVKLLRDISQRLTRKGLPPTVNLNAACAAQDAISMQSATENEVDLSKGGPSCTQSRDIEAPDDPSVCPSSVSSHTMKNGAAEGQAERITSSAADGKEQTSRRTFPATSANTAVKNSHPFAQVEVLLLLAALISLWLTRSTGSNGKRGWGLYFVPNFVDDSVPVLLLGLFLFFLPLEPPDFTWNCFCCRMKSPTNGQRNYFLNEEASHRSDEGRRKRQSKRSSEAEELQAGHSGGNNSRTLEREDENDGDSQGGPQRMSWLGRFRQECQRSAAQRKEYTPILTYSYAVKHIEWGALLLLGGGFAMATSMKRTGLDLWIGNAVLRFAMLDRPALVVSVLLLASCLTEVMSNTATANVLLPILNGVARQAKDSPLLVLIPATVGAQFAFMLPLGTAPNAIVLKKGKLRPLDMFWTGLVVKVFAIGATMLAMMTWSDWLFDLKTRPAWAG